MRYVVDTHALIWYFAGDKQLSQKVKSIIQAAEQGDNEIIVPVIVLLEAIDIQEKKKLTLISPSCLILLTAEKAFKLLVWTLNILKRLLK